MGSASPPVPPVSLIGYITDDSTWPILAAGTNYMAMFTGAIDDSGDSDNQMNWELTYYPRFGGL